jgi:hypothetical protein
MLPMCDIANLTGGEVGSSSKRSLKSTSFMSDSTVLGMDLTTGHEAFVSALRMSWGWRHQGLASSGAAAPMAFAEEVTSPASNTFSAAAVEGRRGSLVTVESSQTSGRNVRLSVAKFLERFATSSESLAVQLLGQQEGVSRLGVLYDQILTTYVITSLVVNKAHSQRLGQAERIE